jgi:addiction module HigA family antidote
MTLNRYHPDIVSPPGDTLRDTLEALGLEEAQAARLLRLTRRTLGAILDGRAPITEEIAGRLAALTGTSAQFWINRQAHYDAWQANEAEEEEREEE